MKDSLIDLWKRLGLTRDNDGRPAGTIDNIVELLDQARELQPFWDTFSLSIHYGPRGWTAEDYLDAIKDLRRLGLRNPPPLTVKKAVRMVAERHTTDIARNYVDSIRWDGTPRIAQFLEDFTGADCPSWYSTYLWRSIAARILHPGTPVDYALVLSGGDHDFKLHALEAATCPWFEINMVRRLRRQNPGMSITVVNADIHAPEHQGRFLDFMTRSADTFAVHGRRALHLRRGVVVAFINDEIRAGELARQSGLWVIPCNTRVRHPYPERIRAQHLAEAVSQLLPRETTWQNNE